MRLLKAFREFLRVCFDQSECIHPRVNLIHGPCHCPDCGYKVKIMWNMLLCRGCDTRLVSQKSMLGEVKPLHTYCRHCGGDRYKLIKKSTIEAYELIYAISEMVTGFGEDESQWQPAVKNPFTVSANIQDEDIIDAEIVEPDSKTQQHPKKNPKKATRKTTRDPKSAFATPPLQMAT